MADGEQVLRSIHVLPESLEDAKFLLSPNDFFSTYCNMTNSWPLFFDYDIDGDTFVDGLKKFLAKYPFFYGRVRPDEDTRYVIVVDSSQSYVQGVPFSELKLEGSVAAAIYKHMQLRTETADYPIYPTIPPVMESLDTEALQRGEEPLMKVKLTHLDDGCVVSVAAAHMLEDGQRYVEALRDLSRGCRGIEIPERDHDRSYLWPDQLVKHFDFLGDEVANLPRKVLLSGESIGFLKYPEEGCQIHIVHIPKDTVEKMKSMVKPFLSEGEFVSSNDVIASLSWMLQCELQCGKKTPQNGADLDVTNTFILMPFEALRNGYPIVPENYSGNAFGVVNVTNDGLDLSEASLPEVFAKLALTTRKLVDSIKNQPYIYAQLLLAYYMMTSTGKLLMEVQFDRFRGPATSLAKMPFMEIDFGKGPPVLSCLPFIPFSGGGSAIGPGPRDDGFCMFLQMRDSQMATFQNSVVLKQMAPGAVSLFTDLTVDELKDKLRMV